LGKDCGEKIPCFPEGEYFMGRDYYLYQHKNGVFYAELMDPSTGARIARRSTGTRSRDEAVAAVTLWLRDGLPPKKGEKRRTIEAATGLAAILQSIRQTSGLDTDGALQIVKVLRGQGLVDFPVTKAGPGKQGLIPFLLAFWNYDQSPYIQDKLLHGHSESRRHCVEAARRVKNRWAAYFADRALNSITRQDLRDFALSMKTAISPKTINNVLSVGIVAIRWAFTEGLIAEDPTRGLVRFSGGETKRDVLTEAETEALFAADWKDNRVYAGALLAATTGLRSGEVRDIRKDDIGDLILTVKHSYYHEKAKFSGIGAEV
jgi:hypothetical protein